MFHLIKNTLRKIKISYGRFLSIIAIIALGVSVFLGLYESTQGMLYTADNYFDASKLMDFKITSTHGFTENDIKVIKEIPEIEKIFPTYSIDVLYKSSSVRLHALEKGINDITLVKGRMPKNKNECLGDFDYFKLKSKVNFEKENIKDYLNIKSCKVVGLISSPLYIREDKGLSSIGSGKLNSFIYVDKDAFNLEFFTEIYLLGKNTIEKDSYFELYEEEVEKINGKLSVIKPIRETIRYEEILKEVTIEVNNLEKEFEEEFRNSYLKLSEEKTKLDNAREELSRQHSDGEKIIKDKLNELYPAKNNLLSKLKSLGLDEESLIAKTKELKNGITLLSQKITTMNASDPGYEKAKEDLKKFEEEFNILGDIKSNLDVLNNSIAILENELNSLNVVISDETKKLNSAYSEYENAKATLDFEKEKFENKIGAEKEKINTLEKPKWYLLKRDDNSGYISYKEDIIKVDSISRILPIFFLLVVSLMVLNTLSRLIEEERNEIGILLANGFSKIKIIFSFLFYVLLATTIGLGIGLTVGYTLIPKVVYSVFLARYYVPKLITIVSPLPFSLVIVITFFLVTIITLTSLLSDLRKSPSTLLRPKAPKIGKKIFLEYIPFVWDKLNFISKTTLRNLFRYKKRIIMTILGVSGSTALLIAGLGINDSINKVSDIQYKNIIKYDSSYILNKDFLSVDKNLSSLLSGGGVNNYILTRQEGYKFNFKNKVEDVFLIIPEDEKKFSDFVSLNNTHNKESVSITDEGAIITKQMGELLGVHSGDFIEIRNNDNELFFIKVDDIVENYVSHFIYLNKSYAEKVFEEEILYNSFLAIGSLDRKTDLNSYDIIVANYTKDIAKTFDGFVKGLNKIIIMIVVFAGALGLAVLYNLTAINLSERKREVATFKVLGFHTSEISIFVFRETLILSILGMLLGTALGNGLHKFIIYTAETDNIVFLKNINITSYVVACLITLIFTALVGIASTRNLRKINMVESLKITE